MVLANPYLWVLHPVHSFYSSQPPSRERGGGGGGSAPFLLATDLGWEKASRGAGSQFPTLSMEHSNLPFICKHVSKGGHCAHVSPP